jgi:hypothetical protein
MIFTIDSISAPRLCLFLCNAVQYMCSDLALTQSYRMVCVFAKESD